jgi:hypothetical protein
MNKKPNCDRETSTDAEYFEDNPALKRVLDSVVYDIGHPVKKKVGTIKRNFKIFYRNWEEEIKPLAGYFLITGLCLLGMRGCNMLWNNSETITPSRHTLSRAAGLVGHQEYTKYADGSADLKVYPGNPLGHRWFESRLYQDLNGDGKVERIRINGPEFTLHHLKDILSRDAEYSSHKEDFDLGERILAEESKKLK